MNARRKAANGNLTASMLRSLAMFARLIFALTLAHVACAASFATTISSDAALADRAWADEPEAAAPADGTDAADSAPVAPPPDALDQYPTRSKSSVYFARGSVDLTNEALATIGENAERLRADRRLSVTLVGYTDDLSSSSYSIALADRRTAAVAEALVELGVLPRQIRATAFGQEDADTVPCMTEICRISYRRVEFRYLKPRDNEPRSTRAGGAAAAKEAL